MTVNKGVIRIIKKLRIRNNLTQKKLAEKIGVTQSYISKLERNGNEEYEKVMIICNKLAQALNVCPFLIAIWAMDKKLNYILKCDLIEEFERENKCNKCSYTDCKARIKNKK